MLFVGITSRSWNQLDPQNLVPHYILTKFAGQECEVIHCESFGARFPVVPDLSGSPP